MFGLLIAVVALVLVANSAVEIWFRYQDQRNSLLATTQLPWSSATLEERRFDALRLLRQVPAITEIVEADASGREQLRVSRLDLDRLGGGADISNDPAFSEAMAHKVYYGPDLFP